MNKKTSRISSGNKKIPYVFFSDQVNLDQQKYSRYVCDSRAIPHEIDGLKPVQRRILWSMWTSSSRTHFTKTVKIAGLTMAYHPHGDKSIQDAISAMVQNFPFANNYPLIAGEGTFGDVVDPSAIASPRYTEVKLSDFVIDIGFFEGLEDIDFVKNYDETDKEPIFFTGKIPVVLLNNIMGIATGFRCNMPGHKLKDVTKSMIAFLKRGKPEKLKPWNNGFHGLMLYKKNSPGEEILTTGFGFNAKNGITFLTDAPQNWNRNRVIDYLETLIDDRDAALKDYTDTSNSSYKIELVFKRGFTPTDENLLNLFSRVNNETLARNVITIGGSLKKSSAEDIIIRFCRHRKKHLIRRFKRLSLLEQEKIKKNSELIRFIKEKWNQKVITIPSKSAFESRLKASKFQYCEWLAGLPVYRMTKEEVNKCLEGIVSAKEKYKYFQKLVGHDKSLTDFMITEIKEIAEKWGP